MYRQKLTFESIYKTDCYEKTCGFLALGNLLIGVEKDGDKLWYYFYLPNEKGEKLSVEIACMEDRVSTYLVFSAKARLDSFIRYVKRQKARTFIFAVENM